jgi:hypothetical protein
MEMGMGMLNHGFKKPFALERQRNNLKFKIL